MTHHRLAPSLTVMASLVMLSVLWNSCSLINQEPPNQSPLVQVREADTTIVARGGRVDLTVTASDEDDDPLRYEWTSGGSGSFTDSLSSSTSWIAPAEIFGNSEFFLISVTIIDSQPETEDPVEAFLIEVVQRAPVLFAPSDTLVSFREPSIDLEARATDEDNDALTFEWELLEGGLTADRLRQQTQTRDSVSTMHLLPLEPGDVALAVSTTDGSDTIRAEFTVSVPVPQMPEGGMVTLELETSDSTGIPYEIDVYEYPNQRGVEPLLVDDWFQASALCREQGKRLCSSLEWIGACQGPEGNSFSSRDVPSGLPTDFGFRFCNGVGGALASDNPGLDEVAPSGSYPNCASSTGVFDMSGNAYEWLMDLDPFRGRQGTVSLSGTLILSPCGTIDTRQPPVPFADEMDDSDRAVVDSLLSLPENQGYQTSDRGFRCCR